METITNATINLEDTLIKGFYTVVSSQAKSIEELRLKAEADGETITRLTEENTQAREAITQLARVESERDLLIEKVERLIKEKKTLTDESWELVDEKQRLLEENQKLVNDNRTLKLRQNMSSLESFEGPTVDRRIAEKILVKLDHKSDKTVYYRKFMDDEGSRCDDHTGHAAYMIRNNKIISYDEYIELTNSDDSILIKCHSYIEKLFAKRGEC